jgi:ketosteroid isomerase-like protein
MANAELVASWYRDAPQPWDETTIAWWSENVWSPDIEWRAIEGAPDDVGEMHGRQRLARYYGEWAELFDQIRHELRECRDVGEKVVVRLHIDARNRSSGMPLDIDYAIVCELEDGKMRRGREYSTLDEALQAAHAVASPAIPSGTAGRSRR